MLKLICVYVWLDWGTLMNIKGYFSFIKWYFNYVSNECFDNVKARYAIRRKERLPAVILAYIMMILSLLCFFIAPKELGIYIALVLMICSALFLLECRFSFIYYFISYIRFNNKDNSINDKALFEHCIKIDYPTDITKMISKYFKIYETKGNVFTLKFYLGAKSKKARKETNFATKILKITPNKIYFDSKIIFENKLSDISDLERFLSKKCGIRKSIFCYCLLFKHQAVNLSVTKL